MADPPGPDQGDEPSAGTPRWVKVFGVVALALVLLFVFLLLTGPGSHGPGRHSPAASGSAPLVQRP